MTGMPTDAAYGALVPEAVLLAASSADLVRRAGKHGTEKGILLAPYAGWTAFATALSASIARRNRGQEPRRG